MDILATKDDSHTLYSSKYGAHYHSIHGALEESIHIFISAGLYRAHRSGKTAVSIFEMGFGTGLNAYLTAIETKRLNISIDYSSIESDPITMSQAQNLNYPSLLNSNKAEFLRLHEFPWDNWQDLSSLFRIKKIKSNIEDYNPETKFDIIYFDAFAPSSQPHLWTEDIHTMFYNSLNPDGCLVTYCTQGAFRRMLEGLGYRIEKLDGPGKKREMLRAVKQS